MITFIPLSVPYAAVGSHTSVRTKLETNSPEQDHPRALAYLLQMDDVRVLVDCGSPEDFLFSGITSFQDASASSNEKAESSTMAQQRESDQDNHLDLSSLKSGPLDTLLSTLAPTIDLVLLSHSSLDNLGLYAYAHASLGLRCQVYATMPVQSMGKLTVLEAIQTLRSEIDVDRDSLPSPFTRRCLATVNQVEEAFEDIKTVRYMQPTHLEGKCASLTLTAYNAGHSLGGAIWKIRSPTSGTVVIALDWNHNRERHLDGTILLSSSAPGALGSGGGGTGGGSSDAVRRPDLLITEIERGLVTNTRRKDRDAAIIELVHNTIQSRNSLLFPIDASARLLELMVLLDQHWAYAYPHARFPLILISRTGKEVIERSRTYMEWMTREWATKANETIEADKDKLKSQHPQNKPGKGSRTAAASNPLDFKYVKVYSSLQAMDEAIPKDQPKVILAVPPSMTHGPSRRLLARFAANPNDVVVLISRGEPGSLCRQLWDAWNGGQAKGFLWSQGKIGDAIVPNTKVHFELKSKVPLEGDELRAHLEAEQAERDRRAQQRALLARSRRRLEADEDDSSDDSDSDGEVGEGEDVYNVAGSGEAPEGGGGLVRKRPYGAAFAEPSGGTGQGVDTNQLSYDIYLKGNASRATSFFGSAGKEGPFGLGVRFRLFPAIERKRLVDGFGEVIDIARWLSRRRAVEAAESAAADPLSENAALTAEAKRKKAADDEAKASAAIPSKYITEAVDLILGCKIAFIEMTGLNDGRALKTLIPQLHPRRLVMVNGDADTRQDMVDVLGAIKGLTNEMFAPVWMQSVKIGEVTNSYTVNLGEKLLARLELSRFEEFEVAHVRAVVKIGADGAGTIPVLETENGVITTTTTSISTAAAAAAAAGGGSDDVGEGEDSSAAHEKVIWDLTNSGIIRSSPTNKDSVQAARLSPPHYSGSTRESVSETLFIGDLKLSTLKSALGSSPYRLAADFAGEGMLVCAPAGSTTGPDAVTVQKQAKGRIVIEGNVTKSFGRVRGAVYGLHARVAGSGGDSGTRGQEENEKE
ncbi:related to CFT2 - subunit of the mRNA cleavage and polyadenlylation factor [Melanopsichium pennsylvanicum]|uniref:Cleavage and polyadenylation specificity factor subunit 2 n=2 Tax=Melanopsichium pennsylvanicum TaxID=63383 RepID=A0AAJ5C4N3_9BASI|nr:cleavage and polyadenylation specificity factor subunit [Melanopsichium pennsylvanicum 4]SNX83866.1 related to CFT2 - subunit of the mRNA cleavage and polyadenlylation factor [Melanopsichium pennsylvanicum]